jgi:hypothetical protein
MQRPSGVTSLSSRKVVSEAILSPQNNIGSKHFLKDFTEIAALRLWTADFGVHNGNIGVAKINGEYRIVGIDFGAAFSKLNPEVNPYSRTKTGIEAHKFYKNHFLEYEDGIIKSNEMAKAFIKIGFFDRDKIHQWVEQSTKETLDNKFDKNALLKFAQRLGMKTKELDELSEKTELQILVVIKTYMKVGLEARSKSLLYQGYALLLENCYDKENQKVDDNALRKIMVDYPQIAVFAQSEFRKMNLVVNNSHVPGKDALLKDILIYHVNRIAAQERYSQEKKAEKTLDPIEQASLREVEKAIAYENNLIARYEKTHLDEDARKLRLAHQAVIDTFVNYAESDMLPGNAGLQLRDQIIKNDQALHKLNAFYGTRAELTLMKVLPGKAVMTVKEEAPKMRRATVIAAKQTADMIKKKIRASAPLNGEKDARKLAGDNNKHAFFQLKTKALSQEGPTLKPKNDSQFGKKK